MSLSKSGFFRYGVYAMDRTDPNSLKFRLQAAGAWSKKNFGQHFLLDRKVLQTIVEAADLHKEETVVEIGPGLGVLTEELVKRVKRVIAFEIDPQMIALLKEDFPNLEIFEGDVLKLAPQVIERLDKYKLVANIPYQITTPLLKLFLEGKGGLKQPVSLTMLVQKEVGQRLAAAPCTGLRGYLSVLCQYYAEVKLLETVPRQAFWPSPQVESAVVQLKVLDKRRFSGSTEVNFLRFVAAAFAQRRKQLKNVLAGIRGVAPAEAEEWLNQLNINRQARAQELSLEEWYSLFTFLYDVDK